MVGPTVSLSWVQCGLRNNRGVLNTRHLILHQHRAIQPDGRDVGIAEVIPPQRRDRVGFVVHERFRLSQISPRFLVTFQPGDG
jgi:hypothetical protein